MKVAIVHDSFTQLGLAERIVEEIVCMIPHASLFATVAYPEYVPGLLKHIDIRTSWLQKLPLKQKYGDLWRYLCPFGVSSLDLSAFDLVISSSSFCAKSVKTSEDAVHVCYCHTPMDFAWGHEEDAKAKRSGISGVTRRALWKALKCWDQASACRPDHFIAQSRSVAARIREHYGRCAEVIYPPIDTNRFRPSPKHGEYYLFILQSSSSLRVDLVVQACTRLRRKLLILGMGGDCERLKSLVGPTVGFIGSATDTEVEHHVSHCRALLFPGEEDFATTLLEVAAAGRPTIAYRAGGAPEVIVEDRTGIFFNELTAEHLIDAIERFEQRAWSTGLIRLHAEQFSAEAFQDHFSAFLQRIGIPLLNTRTGSAPESPSLVYST